MEGLSSTGDNRYLLFTTTEIVVKDFMFTQSDLNSSVSQVHYKTEIFRSIFKGICSTFAY